MAVSRDAPAKNSEGSRFHRRQSRTSSRFRRLKISSRRAVDIQQPDRLIHNSPLSLAEVLPALACVRERSSPMRAVSFLSSPSSEGNAIPETLMSGDLFPSAGCAAEHLQEPPAHQPSRARA